MYEGHWFGFGGGFMWLFWILIILAIVLLIRGVSGGQSTENRETPLEILKKRYARGEIDEEEYKNRRKELE